VRLLYNLFGAGKQRPLLLLLAGLLKELPFPNLLNSPGVLLIAFKGKLDFFLNVIRAARRNFSTSSSSIVY